MRKKIGLAAATSVLAVVGFGFSSGVASAAPSPSPNASCLPVGIGFFLGAPLGTPGVFESQNQGPGLGPQVASIAQRQPCPGP
jgi:hypothetical protein